MRFSLLAVAVVMLLMACALFAARAATEGETCEVRLSLIDEETGESLPGVIRVRTSDGETLPLDKLLPRGLGLGEGDAISQWWALVEPTSIELPRAELEVSAFHGLETELTTRTIDLREETQANVALKLRRFHHAQRSGLMNANTHVHLSKVTRAESDRYLIDASTADGLDLVFVSYLERAEDDVHYVTNEYSRSELKALNTDHVHFDHGEEHRHNFTAYDQGYGHVMLLSIPELVYPVSIGPGISKTGTDGIPLRRGIERAHDMGGTVIWCHNAWGLEDVPSWMSGRLHANNIFDGGSNGSFDRSFYRYWNAGIKVPVSTGTDWFIYDFSRVYVPAAGRVAPEEWLDQLAAGRSFITNGPLLTFEVNGHRIGEDVALNSPGTITVKAAAKGRVDFERIEVLLNGDVGWQAETRPRAGHFVAELEIALDVDRPCWLALRTPPPSVPNDPQFSTETPQNEYGKELFSHTSATFVDIAGRRVFDADAGKTLLADMQESRPFIVDKGLFADEAERRAVLEVYDEGISLMETRLAEAASAATE